MPSCNVVFGRTGCGKTSLLNMLCGRRPERASFSSGTEEASVRDVEVDGQAYKYVDTAGVLDNRGGGADSKQARTDHVNCIARLLKEKDLAVARVLYCVTISERVLQEEIAWLADIVHMLGGEKVLRCFAIVLTKADDCSPQKEEFDQEGEQMELVKALRLAFKHCPIVTSGVRNLDEVKRLLIPQTESPAFSIQPEEIKVIQPMNEIEAQLDETQERIDAVEGMLHNKQTRNQHLQDEIRHFEREMKKLLVQTEGRCFPFWDEHLSKKNAERVSECMDTIAVMREAANKVQHDHVAFEEQKRKLQKLFKKVRKEVKARRAWAQTFSNILTLGVPDTSHCFGAREKAPKASGDGHGPHFRSTLPNSHHCYKAAREARKAAGDGPSQYSDTQLGSDGDDSEDDSEFELLQQGSTESVATVPLLSFLGRNP